MMNAMNKMNEVKIVQQTMHKKKVISTKNILSYEN